MKISKFLFGLLIAVAIGSATIYTSCVKDPCSGVNCLNGGSCNSGSCICPAGYNGTNCENINVTTITINNDAPTPINLTVNGSTTTVPYGGSVSYNGNYGSTLTVSATTQSSSFGQTISWETTTYTFPAVGTNIVPIDVPSTFFYLTFTNMSSNTVNELVVNYGTTSATDEYPTINPGTSNAGIGYYYAYTNTVIRAYYPGGFNYVNPAFSFVPNQVFNFSM